MMALDTETASQVLRHLSYRLETVTIKVWRKKILTETSKIAKSNINKDGPRH